MSLKGRYKPKWKDSNRREQLVLRALEIYLPGPYRPVLSGLGAGSQEFIQRSYNGLPEAFDITVLYHGYPVAYIDVTGVEKLRRGSVRCSGYCVGSWKLEKCRRYGVCDRTWIAFVVDESWRISWMPMERLESIVAGGRASECRLYRDERAVYCSPPSSWLKWWNFVFWLRFSSNSRPTGGEVIG